MGEEDQFDWQRLFSDFRKSASVKAGAALFGEAQIAYHEVIKQHMSEEDAFNLLAHTTECMLKALATAAGPVCEAMLKASFLWENLKGQTSDKEVPGS